MDTGDAIIEAARIEARSRQLSTYVKMTEAITDRQATIIRYYISLHTAMIGAGGAVFVSAFSIGEGRPSIYLFVLVLLLCLVGWYFCKLWRRTLQTMRDWEDRKYEIIRDIERSDTAFIPLYADELREEGAELLDSKQRARKRITALPQVFSFLYRSIAIIIFLALVIQIDAQIFDGWVLNWLDGYVPGLKDLLSGAARTAESAR